MVVGRFINAEFWKQIAMGFCENAGVFYIGRMRWCDGALISQFEWLINRHLKR